MLKAWWNNLTADPAALFEQVIGILLILVLARILVRVSRGIIARTYRRRAEKLRDPIRQKRMETASTLVQSITRYVIWFFALCGIVGVLGLTGAMTSMLAAAGIGGVALGIGAQSFVKDVVSGLFLLFEDQMAVGDYVTIAGVTGTVEEVALRNTTVKGFRGELNVIPNGMIDVLTNYSRADYLAQVDVQIAFEADAARAMALMKEEAAAYADGHDNAVEAPEVLGVTTFDREGLNLRMVLKVKPLTHWATERELNRRIQERFAKEGVKIAYPRVVTLRGEEAHG